MTEPLRFGICRNQTLPWETLLRHFQEFERLGFDSAWDCDHFQRPSEPEAPYFEGWTTLAALATTTKRIRLGVLVSSNTFRHPALLAKQAVTVDHLSGGRLELGIGTGWYEAEHHRFGLAFPPASELVGRFREAVEIIDLMLRNDLTSYDGTYYRLQDAPCRPAPVQRPRPPFTLGAHRPKMLRIVAQYADRWNSFGTVAEIRERNTILDEQCVAIGRDPKEILRSFFGQAPRDTMAGRLQMDPWDSPEAFLDIVGQYREVGIQEFIMDGPREDQFAVMERVAADVLPALRAEGTTARA